MIVVFGSINVDLVVRVASLPRPGETVVAPSYEASTGGKGANQAVSAARAGARTHMVGCVGRDSLATTALAALSASKVDIGAVKTVGEATGCAMICVDPEGQNQITVASGANRRARSAQVEDALLGPETTLILQHEVDPEETWAVARRGHERGAYVVLNCAPAAPIQASAANAIDVLVANEIEATMLANASGLPARDPVSAARSLASNWGVTTVVTLGKEGATAFDHGVGWHVSALPGDIIDTTAAGDAFVGVLAAALDNGNDLPAALRRASVAGGLACRTLGAQPSLPTDAQIGVALKGLAPAQRL